MGLCRHVGPGPYRVCIIASISNQAQIGDTTKNPPTITSTHDIGTAPDALSTPRMSRTADHAGHQDAVR